MKLLYYFLSLILSTILMLLVTSLYTCFEKHGVLFFSAFFIAFLCSFIGLGVWYIKYKNGFENFLIILTFIMFNTLFVYFGPVTLDRSLSSFIYFYSVEENSIPRDIFNKEYFEPYVQRRFEDGEKIGYLKCSEQFCYPTLKSKLTYWVFYPFGRLTGTLSNYDEFKQMMKNH